MVEEQRYGRADGRGEWRDSRHGREVGKVTRQTNPRQKARENLPDKIAHPQNSPGQNSPVKIARPISSFSLTSNLSGKHICKHFHCLYLNKNSPINPASF